MLKEMKMIFTAALLALVVSAALDAAGLVHAGNTTEKIAGIVKGYSCHGNLKPPELDYESSKLVGRIRGAGEEEENI